MTDNTYFNLFNRNRPFGKKERNLIYSQLFQDFHISFFVACHSYGFSTEDSRDIVSDFFLNNVLPQKRFKNFMKVATDPDSNFEAYIYQSFKNYCMKEMLKKKKAKLRERSFLSLKCPSLELYNLKPNNEKVLHKILSILPERQRLALHLWLHGFTAKEIAIKIGVSAKVRNKARAIRNVIYRAILTLKKRFGECDDLILQLS